MEKKVVRIVKFTYFEMNFLSNLGYVINDGFIYHPSSFTKYELTNVKPDSKNRNTTCYIFEKVNKDNTKNDDTRIEFHRQHNNSEYNFVYIKSNGNTAYGGELINCKMRELGCKCDTPSTQLCRIIGYDYTDEETNKSYQTYITLDPIYEENTVSRTTVDRKVNGVSYVSAYQIECSGKEIRDDVLNSKKTPVLENYSNYESTLMNAVFKRFRYEPMVKSFYSKELELITELYEYIKGSYDCMVNDEKKAKK